MKKPVFLLLFLVCCLIAKAQLSVVSIVNYTTPVQNLLGGCCAQTSNVQYSGAQIAGGAYNATQTSLGVSHGIILTSGSRSIAIGPNNTASAGLDNNLPGNYLLSQLCGYDTYDATVLEFNYVSPVNAICGFKYVFASEEYPEFVGQIYNDIFTCMLSGPDIDGELNIATVPDSNLSVNVNNYNILTYPHYFVDNAGDTEIQYDGYTFPLTAKFIAKAGMTYHIRLMIADAGDHVYDSGVFIESANNTTDVDETQITGDNKFTVYPNPAQNSLTIKSNSLGIVDATIDLLDISGKKIQAVYTGKMDFLNSTATTDISSLPPGLYIIRVATATKLYNVKVLKT